MIKVYHSGPTNFKWQQIDQLIGHAKGQYIGEYAWTDDQIWTMFFSQDPELDEHHQLYGFRFHTDPFTMDTHLRVCGLDERSPVQLSGLYLPTEEAFVMSRSVHDYYSTPFGFAVDGGGDYLRTVGTIPHDMQTATFNPLTMRVKHHNGRMIVESDAQYADETEQKYRGTETYEVDSERNKI